MAALIVSLIILPQLGTECLPELNEGSIWVNFTLPAGSWPPRGESHPAPGSQRPAEVPEVARDVCQAGRPDDGTDPKPINMTEMLVDLKPEPSGGPA